MQRAWLLLALVLGCNGERASDTVLLRVQGHAERPLMPDTIRYEPADNVRSARLSAQGWLAIERRSAARALTIEIPEYCPVTFAAGPQPGPIAARPVIDLGPDRAPVGFDAPFAIEVAHGCPERGRGAITWRQLEGVALSELSVARAGFELRARTPRFGTLHPEPLPAGIVPISPRTQGRVVLEALWQRPGAPPIRRSIAIASTSRTTGLSSVSVSQQLLLSGADWRVHKAPRSGHAEAHASSELSVFTPDAPGRWILERSQGQALVVQALSHDQTPYDCGRSECHASIAATTRTSPMSFALQRQLESPSPPGAVGCMLDCHVLGERGAHDGGFLDVSAQLGFSWLASTRWPDLPQPLRRLGGVRCTACHGPGALPEPEGRELVLRSDVCASCHDAPPRYTRVAQWGASRMARSDAVPSTRAGACAGCHTTAGFLERVAGRSHRELSVDAEPVGIACAACHAPHSSHRGARLLREVPANGDGAREPRTALCLSCHAPAADEAPASAPSGALWAGQVRVPTANGAGWEELRAAGAHGRVPNGCIGCHGATAEGRIDHSFRIGAKSCTPCHVAPRGEPLADDSPSLQQRARTVAQALARACSTNATTSIAAHASPAATTCDTPLRTRALYEAKLVLEDPAAFVHNPQLARLLLQDAERSTDL